MSDRAKELLAEAIHEYQSGDGASRLGSYRDAATDILHLVYGDEKLRKDEKCEDSQDWFSRLRILLDETYQVFIEEKEEAEMAEVDAIPLKELPLHIEHDWIFDGSRQRLEQRLRDKDGTD